MSESCIQEQETKAVQYKKYFLVHPENENIADPV